MTRAVVAVGRSSSRWSYTARSGMVQWADPERIPMAMHSLLVKEGMAGKVQTIYIDPPDGIKIGRTSSPV